MLIANMSKQISTGKITADFSNKISGSTVENPNSLYVCIMNAIKTPANITGNFATGFQESSSYTTLYTLDGVYKSGVATTSNNIPQQMYTFNLIEIVKRVYGDIMGSALTDKVAWLQAHVARIDFNFYGYGTSPAGNILYFDAWDNGLNAWENIKAGTKTSNMLNSSTIAPFTYVVSNPNPKIDSNGKVNFLSYTDISTSINSVVNIDYASITLYLK